jgi:hypothetical protein
MSTNTQERAIIVAQIKNAIFPSKEGEGIEHVDMSYKILMMLLDDLI